MKKNLKAFTLSCKTFRSDSSQAKLTQPPAQSSQTKYRNCVAHSYGFTLSEAMIVLVVLGIVAAMTIPAVVRRQIEAANRTKIKKTMKVFDLLTNKIVVENDLKSTSALHDWATANDCENILKYFKPVKFIPREDKTTTNCRFMTSDKVAWDLTNYPDAVFSLDEDKLDDEDSAETFKPHAHFDANGTLRVNDLAWEQANSKDKKLIADIEKLYNPPKKSKAVTASKPQRTYQHDYTYYPTGELREDKVYYIDELSGKKILSERIYYKQDGSLSQKITWDNDRQIATVLAQLTNGNYATFEQQYNGKLATAGEFEFNDFPGRYAGTFANYTSLTAGSNTILKKIYDSYDIEKDSLGNLIGEVRRDETTYNLIESSSISYKNGAEYQKTVTTYENIDGSDMSKTITKYTEGKITQITERDFNNITDHSFYSDQYPSYTTTSFTDYDKGLKSKVEQQEYKYNISDDIYEQHTTTRITYAKDGITVSKTEITRTNSSQDGLSTHTEHCIRYSNGIVTGTCPAD